MMEEGLEPRCPRPGASAREQGPCKGVPRPPLPPPPVPLAQGRLFFPSHLKPSSKACPETVQVAADARSQVGISTSCVATGHSPHHGHHLGGKGHLLKAELPGQVPHLLLMDGTPARTTKYAHQPSFWKSRQHPQEVPATSPIQALSRPRPASLHSARSFPPAPHGQPGGSTQGSLPSSHPRPRREETARTGQGGGGAQAGAPRGTHV